MPADYSSTAQALSLPISPSTSTSPPPTSTSPKRPSAASGDTDDAADADDDGPVPPWVRAPRRGPGGMGNNRNSDSHQRSARRLSTPYSRTSTHEDLSLGQRITQTSLSILNKLLKLFYSLTPVQRVLAIVAGVAALALGIVFLVFSHKIFSALAPVAKGWRALPGGWILVFLITSLAAFPPMIGYSSCITIAGIVYGFPGGWPIVAAATVVGSTASFVASRTVLSKYVHRLVGEDKRFVALGHVLRHDGLWVLAAIRFCPLPYSLSNGFLATIPSVSPASFALATALATPKLLVHVFIGSRLALLAEDDDMSLGDKVVNYLSMLLGSALGIAVGLIIYRRTMARAKQLAREEAAGNGIVSDAGEDDDLNYEDLEEGVMGGRQQERAGEADAAALMDDDDMSLWDNDDDAYRDEDDGSTGAQAFSDEHADGRYPTSGSK
ncbi:Uu.00g046680.m01.CDS01 [Anthostomella pinea]|uniref:Golgi apparatus membrane protein TVP38 n=1 Tax=Anthostomella pinea TaxID=933095 RepID=A0AAI8VBE1_9PEZI|nr:Uu.00g046680.m01.CDS01 [Anthostomella pinea]